MAAVRPSVYVTQRVLDVVGHVLTEHGITFEVRDEETPATPEALREAVVGRRGVICQIRDRFDAALLSEIAGSCKVIATISVGVDHIDVEAARGLGIHVTNTPDALTETTADLTWALMLAAARRLGEAERFVRAGRWTGWGLTQFLGVDVHSATLGIVGGGRIGMAVARRASGFRMNVLCHTRDPGRARAENAVRFVSFETLLRESDFVSLHVPLSPQTHHMIGDAQLQMMKATAILINTARGPVVDETAMIRALQEGRIGGAGLDVFEREPAVPEALLRLDNVVALPHIGSASRGTREMMCRMAAESVVAALRGERPRYVV